jgi:RNA polymerase sigma-70 factor, ECF subfamily
MKSKTELIWNEFCCQLKFFILHRISDATFADDILQEIFIKIHSKIDTLKDDTKIRAWVYQIARNTIIDYYRKHKTGFVDIDALQLSHDDEEENSEQNVSLNESLIPLKYETNEESAHHEIASGLKAMVESLPEKYAQALLLVEFDGLSQIDLAKKLGISIPGAKSRIQRARQMLKDSLMKCCHFEFDKYGTIIESCPNTCCCCD